MNRGRQFSGRRGGGRGFHPRGRPWGNGPFRPAYPPRPRIVNSGPGRRLCEDDLGITKYISSLPGFSGVIKSRYSDFQVNEINVNGEVAKLTSLEAPAEPGKLPVGEDEEVTLRKKFDTDVLPVEVWDKLSSLLAAKGSETFEYEANEMSKDDRTRVYDAVKLSFGSRILGSTVTKNEKKWIVFQRPQQGVRLDGRQKWPWSAEYVHFVLHKENLDTMDAVGRVTSALHRPHIKSSFFGYGGTKDRRAKTSQWVSLRKVDPRTIASACKHLRNISIGNYSFHDYQLRLGYLKGNRFRIALRDVKAENELIETSIASLKENGFLNYYGLQRFGSRADVPTHHIGRSLLKGCFKEAVDMILEPRGPLAQNLQIYRDTHDANLASHGLSVSATDAESRLLLGLVHCGVTNYVSALDRIPRNTRLLYIHAYQSWIWNRCVSERVNRFGLKVCVGDLVAPEIGWEECLEGDVEATESYNEGKKRGVKFPPMEKQDPVITIVTEEELQSDKYTIFDVILPLPGYTIQYPPNMLDYYKEIIEVDGLTLELRQQNKTYSLSGAYRHMLAKPEQVSHKIVRYDDPFGDLIPSDLDDLNGQVIADKSEGKFRALILEFNLPACTYATMALRELLKTDTSVENQAKGNDYHKSDEKVESKSSDDVKESEVDGSDVKVGSCDVNIESCDVKNVSSSDASIESKEDLTQANVDKRKLEEESEEDAKKIKLL